MCLFNPTAHWGIKQEDMSLVFLVLQETIMLKLVLSKVMHLLEEVKVGKLRLLRWSSVVFRVVNQLYTTIVRI